jgi:radical SAM protein with 4Fe4S-binding SPASM domain
VQLKNYLQNKRVPLMTYLELTHRCSFLCVHCYIPESLRQARPLAENPARGLSTVEVKKLLVELAASQALFLVFTGGEIFLRPDLEEITAAAVELGFSVKYYTNGFHITPVWADKIKQLGVYGVDISIYGASEESYYAITKVKGAYQRVLQTLSLLKERGIRFTVKTPVMKQNAHEIPQIKQLAEEHGAYFRYDMVLIPRFDGDETPFEYRLDDHEVEELLQRMQARYNKSAVDFEPHACSVGRWSVVISPEGEVYPCIELRQSLGNIKQQSFSSIWNDHPYMQDIRHQLSQRQDQQGVFADGMCGHCPAFSLRAEGDMTKPSQEHQRLAVIKRKFMEA